MVGLLFMATLLAFLPLLLRWVRKRRQERDRRLSQALGLSVTEGDQWKDESRFTGRLDGAEVELFLFSRSTGKSSTPYTRYTVFGADPRTTLKGQNLATELWQAVAGGEDHRTGDAAFDAAVQVGGHRPALAAALDAPTRQAVLDLVRLGGTVSSGKVSFEERKHEVDPERIRLLFAQLAAVATALAAQPTTDRLVRNVREDPEPGVRRAALMALVETDRARGRELAATLLDDPSPDLRFVAAAAVGDRDRVRSAPPEVKVAAAAENPESVARLLEGAGDEAGLLALLSGGARVRVAACHALARSGTVHAVEPLLPLSRALLGDGDVRQAATAAIAAIQGRLGAVERGTLALADGAGELSVSEEAGAVSLAAARRQTT